MLTLQYAPKAMPPMMARTRTITNSRALRPFFLPDLPGCWPEEAVVLGGIAVLAVLSEGQAVLECWGNHRRRAYRALTRSRETGSTTVRSCLRERQESVKS